MTDADLRVQEYLLKRHQPEKSTLYRLIQKNWLSFKAQVESEDDRTLPKFVVKEVEEYLRCGILDRG